MNNNIECSRLVIVTNELAHTPKLGLTDCLNSAPHSIIHLRFVLLFRSASRTCGRTLLLVQIFDHNSQLGLSFLQLFNVGLTFCLFLSLIRLLLCQNVLVSCH